MKIGKVAKQKRNNGVTVYNKDQLQSYILTTAKYDFNVYEKRLLYRLVEMAQGEIEGLQFSNGRSLGKINHDLFGRIEISMPIASLLSNGEDDKNYAKAKKAVDSLSEKKFYYEDDEVWEKIFIIVSPKVKKYKNTIEFVIEPRLWNCILDFSKGFTKYELVTAMNFKSVYSMRFYELLSNQKHKMTYSLDQLKEMFCVQDKYKLTADFIRYVIEPAKRELDEHSPYSFEWSANKEGKRITSFNFYPIFKSENRDSVLEERELQRKTSLSWDLNQKVIDYLTKSIGFTKTEINNNRELFILVQNTLDDILGELATLKAKSRDKKNPKGWIINAIKGKIKP